MTGRVEQAAGQRAVNFPGHWGEAPPEADSEARASWVTRNAAMDAELRRRGFKPAAARAWAATQEPRLSGTEALARVAALRGAT